MRITSQDKKKTGGKGGISIILLAFMVALAIVVIFRALGIV